MSSPTIYETVIGSLILKGDKIKLLCIHLEVSAVFLLLVPQCEDVC